MTAMPAPYYEQGGVTIFCGDAREVLPSLAADVLITDPPYGVNFGGKATKHTRVKTGGYTREDNALIGPEVVSLALPKVKRGAVFPGVQNLFRYPKPEDIGCIYCPSGAGMGTWGFKCFHPILFYGKRPPSTLRPTSIESFDTADAVDHPCPKPMRWMQWILSLVTMPGETVIDPFAGSGTTLRAAKDAGLRAIGIEVEERYCEVAAKRLAQGVLWPAETA